MHISNKREFKDHITSVVVSPSLKNQVMPLDTFELNVSLPPSLHFPEHQHVCSFVLLQMVQAQNLLVQLLQWCSKRCDTDTALFAVCDDWCRHWHCLVGVIVEVSVSSPATKPPPFLARRRPPVNRWVFSFIVCQFTVFPPVALSAAAATCEVMEVWVNIN